MRSAFAVILGLLLVGCGSKSDPPPAAKLDGNKDGPPATSTAAVVTDTKPGDKVAVAVPPPPAKAAEWEMDLAKHDVPSSPAAGKLGGVAFAPTATIQDNVLTLRVLKDMNPEREITLKLPPDKAKAADGLKVTVRPEQPAGPDVPEVSTQTPNPKADAKFPEIVLFLNGYALTLELGKKANGKRPGKIYLSLPGDAKNFVAGTFDAEWSRNPALPPEPDEGPYVHGSVAVSNVPSKVVRVGYVGLTKAGGVLYDALGLTMDPGVWAKSDEWKPRGSLVYSPEGSPKPGRYDHTHLEPGRYFVFAAAGSAATDGPAAWKWLTVEPDSKVTVDFALDGAKTGKVDVTVPAGTPDVFLVPPSDAASPTPVEMLKGMAIGIGLYVKPDGAKASFPRVAPGKYEVRGGDLVGTVEVEVGKTAAVELKPAKK